MKRSRLLAAGAATFGSIGFVRAAAPAAQFVYKFGHPSPVEFPAHVRMVQMANAVKAQTNGRMEIQIFPNGMLGSQTALIGQLRLGSIQFSDIGNSSLTGLVPAAAVEAVGFAFTSQKQALDAMDGPLGEYVRKEFAAKGIFVFEKVLVYGFRQMTSSTKPVRTVDDMAGFKIRTPPAPISIDLFRTLGAAPVPLDADGLYTALQTHVVDGQESAVQLLEAFRWYEVQKYLSITNHMWGGSWILANAAAWNALPPDIQDVIKRNMEKYTLLERIDMATSDSSVTDKLHRQGLALNTAEVSGMRSRLGPYYARWKNELGSMAWNLLEAKTGKLG